MNQDMNNIRNCSKIFKTFCYNWS